MKQLKVIARIRGGLGNQLFCYAAARRLALRNNAELVIDDVTGFVRDREYQRKYALDVFQISARKATPAERLEPFERLRRAIAKRWSSRKPLDRRAHIVEERPDFDERLVRLQLRRNVYLDGLWQSESYFKDVEDTVRGDLRMKTPSDSLNQSLAERLRAPDAVSIHVRWFDLEANDRSVNMTGNYYQTAIERMEAIAPMSHYVIFSDHPTRATGLLGLPSSRVTVVAHNRSEGSAHLDMWLMSNCSRHITANSTFSWWGAWLANPRNRIVICPDPKWRKSNWNWTGLLPTDWLAV